MTKKEKQMIEVKSSEILNDLIEQDLDFFTIELIVERCNDKLRDLIVSDNRN